MFYVSGGKRGTVHACGNPNAHTDSDPVRWPMLTDAQTSIYPASPSNASAAPIVWAPSSNQSVKPTAHCETTSACLRRHSAVAHFFLLRFHSRLKACFALCVLISFALPLVAIASIRVSITPQRDQTLRFVVVETMRDPAHRRSASRRYEFIAPMNIIIRADEIRHYHARYEGADGVWNTHRKPTAGYILLSNFQHPKTVEFRLAEAWEVAHIGSMTINGRHRVETFTQ